MGKQFIHEKQTKKHKFQEDKNPQQIKRSPKEFSQNIFKAEINILK